MILGRFAPKFAIHALMASSLLFVTGRAMAQEAPGAEVYVGYAALVGLNASAAINWNRWLGVVGDYSYRVAEYYADKPLQTFTAGPRFTFRLIPRVTPFAHALFGAARSGCAAFSDASGCRSGNAFAMVLGGGVDVSAGKNISIRALQIDSIQTRFGGGANAYSGLSFGVVARIGR